MATASPPTSQKSSVRPIGFVLDDGNSTPTSLTLNIRPEDLTVVEPSRLTVQQTLGGAWADDWGPGLRTINISGHTGWRPAGGTGKDGMQTFFDLHDLVWKNWHSKRAKALENGLDPSEIKLIFADKLDNITSVVAPGQFILRRNRSRPLLYQYQISMTVLADEAGDFLSTVIPPATLPNPKEAMPAALVSLRNSLNTIRGKADAIAKGIDTVLGEPVRAFMGMTADVLNVTLETVGSIQGSVDTVTGSLISVASDLSQAGRNIMNTIAAVQGLPVGIKASCMEVAAAYSNAFCLLKNVFRGNDVYEEYSDLYGSSNCSSTSGGRPFSPLIGENPFYRVTTPVRPPLASQTSNAQSATRLLAGMDVLTAQADTNLAARMNAASAGTTVAEAA